MRHRLLILVALAGATLVTAAAALAGTFTATANVTGTAGISFSFPSGPSLTSTLDGTDQLDTYAPVLGVIDARGTGAGWNVSISSTNFDDGAGHTLAPGVVSAASAACHAGSTCTAPTNSVTYPVTISSSPVKLFNAAASTGLGKVDVTPTIGVTIPGNAFAGTYTSTVTLAAASGP